MKYRETKMEVKSWVADLQPYQSAWNTRGGGVYSLGGQSIAPLPSNVYKLSTDFNGEILYIAINIVGDNLLNLPNSKTDEVLQSIETFWNKKEQYAAFGQVHKRGILLFGTPGNGKTSMLDLLFNQVLARGGIVFIVENPSLTISAIQRFRMVEPDRPLILLYEDLDSLFEEWGQGNILSILDGQMQFANVLHLATTNYLDRIPPRLKNRPSRFDEVIEILPPTTDERAIFIRHLMQPVDDKSNILQMVSDSEGFSMAAIKEMIISVYLLDKDYQETIDRLTEMMTGEE